MNRVFDLVKRALTEGVKRLILRGGDTPAPQGDFPVSAVAEAISSLDEAARALPRHLSEMPGGGERWVRMLEVIRDKIVSLRDSPNPGWMAYATDFINTFREYLVDPSDIQPLYDLIASGYRRAMFEIAEEKNPTPVVRTREDWEQLPERWFGDASGH